MSERLTPEERAYNDALTEAVEMGFCGEEALRCADQMRETLWFALRSLHYAGVDVGLGFKQAVAPAARRLLALVGVRPRD